MNSSWSKGKLPDSPSKSYHAQPKSSWPPPAFLGAPHSGMSRSLCHIHPQIHRQYTPAHKSQVLAVSQELCLHYRLIDACILVNNLTDISGHLLLSPQQAFTLGRTRVIPSTLSRDKRQKYAETLTPPLMHFFT